MTTSKTSGKTTRKKAAPKKETPKAAAKKVDYQPTSSFVYMDKVREILDVSLATDKNCILHGKGGYGKSEFSYGYLMEKKIKPYVITMGSGMTTDRLFGGVDLAKFNKTGKIEYLIENSFMNHEYVIFEELFDAPDFILEQLKDILSSGVFRNGGQIFEIKTKNIICCTNKTREEFAKNNSLKALMERFPLELEVKWENHNRLTYENLINHKFGTGAADPLLTYVLEQFAKKGHTISPRIALVAFQIVNECGPKCLEFIADFKAKQDILKDAMSKFRGIAEISEKVAEIDDVIEELEKLINEGMSTPTESQMAHELTKTLYRETTALSKIKADDSLAVSTAEKVKHYKSVHNKISKQIAVTSVVDQAIEELA